MKAVKIGLLSIGIWAASLLWPEINNILRPQVMIGLVIGLGALSLAYLWGSELVRRRPRGGAGPTRPVEPVVPLAVMR